MHRPAVDGFKILDRIGAGGMGTVWKAIQLSTQRPVALKLMSADSFRSSAGKQRFHREVELAARLDHPHIATVLESGLHKGVYFYAMRLVEGARLDDYARTWNADPHNPAARARAIVALMSTVCEAVGHAHGRGVIHRDLKPSNILVDGQGQPIVVDFGLAKSVDDGSDVGTTREGDVVGTPAYMSPEQAGGQAGAVDERTDVYALGVILYELLSGRHPTGATGTPFEVRTRIIGQPIEPLSATAGIDPELSALVLKALSKDASARFPNADAFASALRAYLGAPAASRRTGGARRSLAVAAVILLMGGVSFIAWSLGKPGNERNPSTGKENPGPAATGDEPPAVITEDAGAKDGSDQDPGGNDGAPMPQSDQELARRLIRENGVSMTILSRGATLSVSALTSKVLDDPDLKIRTISSLTGRNMNDQTLAYISRATGLTNLTVLNGSFTAKGMAQLQGLKSLNWVALYSPTIDDACARELAKIPSISVLFLDDSTIGDEGAAVLAGLPNLRWLDLRRTKITDRAMTHFAKILDLQHIMLDETAVTDTGVKLLTQPSLLELSVCGTRATDKSMEHATRHFRLTALYAQASDITDASAAHIAAMKTLHKLNLSDTRLSEQSIAQLLKLPNLRRIELNNTATTDDVLQALPVNCLLEEVLLEHTRITDAGLRTLLERSPKLKSLRTTGTQISREAVAQAKRDRPEVLFWH